MLLETKRSRDPDAKRQAILEFVHSRPGIHKSLLCRSLGLSWGTASYHIQCLHREGLLQVRASGREAYLFPPGIPAKHMAWISHLHNDIDASIMRELARGPGQRAIDLSNNLGVAVRIIRRHLVDLSDVGLVEPDGSYNRRFRLHAGGSGRPAPPERSVSEPQARDFLIQALAAGPL